MERAAVCHADSAPKANKPNIVERHKIGLFESSPVLVPSGGCPHGDAVSERPTRHDRLRRL
jgi:hypothetical protein